MERNAWRVAHYIALRIDDAPVLSDYIRARVTKREENAFFFFQKIRLHESIESSKTHVPGYISLRLATI